MSVSDLLSDRRTRVAVRARLDPLLPEYERTVRAPSLVGCTSGHPQLVGTAFDYAVRIELAHRARHAVAGPWVAEEVVRQLRGDAATHALAARVVGDARRAVARGWPKGEARRFARVAVHAAKLAQLDPYFRAGYPPTFGEEDGVREEAMADEVARLMEIADPIWTLASRRRLLLNPTFGAASTAVGGADADLIAGDLLVEIKTTKHARFERDHARQLLAYVALARACGRRIRRLQAIAVYFSRYGVLHLVPLRGDVGDAAYVRTARDLGAAWRSRRRSPSVRRPNVAPSRSRFTADPSVARAREWRPGLTGLVILPHHENPGEGWIQRGGPDSNVYFVPAHGTGATRPGRRSR